MGTGELAWSDGGGRASGGVLLDLGFIVLIAEDDHENKAKEQEAINKSRQGFQKKGVRENIKGPEKRGRRSGSGGVRVWWRGGW